MERIKFLRITLAVFVNFGQIVSSAYSNAVAVAAVAAASVNITSTSGNTTTTISSSNSGGGGSIWSPASIDACFTLDPHHHRGSWGSSGGTNNTSGSVSAAAAAAAVAAGLTGAGSGSSTSGSNGSGTTQANCYNNYYYTNMDYLSSSGMSHSQFVDNSIEASWSKTRDESWFYNTSWDRK